MAPDEKESLLNAEASQPWPMNALPDRAMCGEAERFNVLASYELDQLDGDEELSRIARFAAQLCKSPIATVSLVEQERQRFLAREGLDISETPRSTSICAHTMLGSGLLEVLDATKDGRFAQFSAVTGAMNLRYYAGVPLVSPEGAPLGALCVIDTVPHDEPLGAFEIEGLEVLAQAVMRRLSNQRQTREAASELGQSEARFELLADSIPDIAWSCTSQFEFDFYNRRWSEFTGTPGPREAEGWRAVIHPDDADTVFDRWYANSQGGESFVSEYRMKTADGGWRWVLSRAVPMHDADGTIIRWFGTVTDVDDGHKLSESRDLIARELAHRIKNLFALITSLVSMRSRGVPQAKEFANELIDTISALARAQDFVTPQSGANARELTSLIAALMAPHQDASGSRITVTGERVPIGSRVATPFALLFHELATNAAKYGALSGASGKVSIELVPDGEDVLLRWSENGGPKVSAPESTGFGMRLIDTAVRGQLGGSLEQDWDESGLRIAVRVPRERLLAD